MRRVSGLTRHRSSRNILLLCAATLTACSVDRNDIHFIVADGYRGPIAVVSNPDFPEPERYRSRGDAYVLVVPETGVVCIPSYTIFHAFLSTAEYADGSVIYEHDSLAPDSDAIRLSGFGAEGGSTDDHGVTWLGVGTESEVRALERAFLLGGAIRYLMPEGVSITRRDNFAANRQYCR